ncbi:MAG: hypothetical protein A3G75_04630 [Verrucomicrobia bacterium RIFCSPLOWO2_12_FULL_64_8]|nr:MAG: hypothetical protein A3G75_04630 [Verrucomicrobia bacterium RIFCSPLOWO2_12_FULL_64_8]
MKIAIPLTATDEFAAHYGAAVQFMIYEVEPQTCTVRRRLKVHPVENQPCHWPVLLQTAGAEVVLAGGMGQKARQHMAEHGVKVLAGVTPADPDVLVAGWLAWTLITGKNACEGGHHAGDGPCPGHAYDHGEAHEHENGCGCAQ